MSYCVCRYARGTALTPRNEIGSRTQQLADGSPRDVSVLVIDPDRCHRTALDHALQRYGVRTTALEQLSGSAVGAHAPRYDLAVLDIGKDLGNVERLRRLGGGGTPFVAITAAPSTAATVMAMRLGALDVYTKSVNPEYVLHWLDPSLLPHELDVTPRLASLERLEWEHIQRALLDCAGNVSEAARTLGIHRRSLQRKLLKKSFAR